MADALCGPSNALQNFQKHTSVDRTLQQDRLTHRHSPPQGFRSSPGPNAGILDPEFDAFQAGHAGPPQPDFHHLPPHLTQHPPPPQFVQAPQGPDWAADFQRLNISPLHPSAPIQHSHAPQASNAASWHQDFMKQQVPAAQAPTYQQNMFGSMSGHGMGGFAGPAFQQSHFGPMDSNTVSEVAQGKQQAQEGALQFDDAAFEAAFKQAQKDMLEAEVSNMREAGNAAQERAADSVPAETDPILLRIKEKRPNVYLAIKLRSEIDLGRPSDALPYLDALETLERSGSLIDDASEAKWCVDALQKIVNRDAPQVIKTRAESLITAINERLMSAYPLLASRVPVTQESIWEDLEAAGYTTRTPLPERVAQQPQQEKKEEQPVKNDDDEMAETAGKLLERVADNTSEKFQKSQFLELMRRLRDREVRVEGDKVVEVNSAQPSTFPLQPAGVPEIDRNILNVASQDFGTVMDSEVGHASDPTKTEPRTDEVSDQFNYYNINSKYHR
ncbi:hypothetical protein K469DRAFT_562696 [Zopfia rhizophila CBS 207.26]|uniref:Uncharacterized protein n=1 Tax=Zopfia rhizophila CBS 207.26 TaxID=1314779 RepID=A0A6A6ED49_9PEZI|nr:hypothetical protein K469DRAFT_562696 [Zopfia rhizophila CBS 207.26]